MDIHHHHQANSTIKNGPSLPPNLQNPTKNDDTLCPQEESQQFSDDIDSSCSTPYVSAPSSPGRNGPINGGFFYSCPASPMHFAITSTAASYSVSSPDHAHLPIGYDFEFSSRLGSPEFAQTGSMSCADDLFLNGQIRPMKLSSHLERPQVLAPLLDLENEEDDDDKEDENADLESKNSRERVVKRGRDLRLCDKSKSLRRRTRSMSPLRSSTYEFDDSGDENVDIKNKNNNQIYVSSDSNNHSSCEISCLEQSNDGLKNSTDACDSAVSSRSSSVGRNSKPWVFLKDFLYRSKSEGRSNNKFWSNISFSPTKEKNKSLNTASVQLSGPKEKVLNGSMESQKGQGSNGQSSGKKPINGVGKRRATASASAHELHYKANKAQPEEMRKKTFLPYRQGLLGCLGFSSKGYGAMNGFAKVLNPVSSR